MSDLGVAYLYRYSESEDHARRFIEGLRRFPAGVPHQLHVLFKGFPDHQSLERAQNVFKGVAFNSIEVDDFGYDVGSYLKAARQASNRRLVFLNTFSFVQSANWLAHLSRALDRPDVGIAGATGSWLARPTGYEVQVLLILSSFMRTATRLFNHGKTAESSDLAYQAAPRPITTVRQALRYAHAPIAYVNILRHYSRHPNPHIRTNAFMVERKLFLSLKFPPLKTKEQAYQFESGRRSMTNQIIARGLTPVVVGRDGKIFNIEEWQQSSTLWRNEQENLLVSDNRTREYAEAHPEFKRLLENLAWRHPRFWQYPISWQKV
ncbi:hypothetical protein [Bradyrhizobium genosp. P]|uniref:hypothetical protein n=1 Tax=Bradyrhizobium genosp. P TaxID=83641 RepID=UPI003CF8E0AA